MQLSLSEVDLPSCLCRKHWSEPEPEILAFEAGGSGIVGHHEYTLLLKDVEYDGTYLKVCTRCKISSTTRLTDTATVLELHGLVNGSSEITPHHPHTHTNTNHPCIPVTILALQAVWAEGGDKSCYHVTPYVDAASGHLHVRLATRTQWKLKDKKIEWTDASCTLTAAEVAAPSCTKIDDHTVHSVSITTHRCKAGNCLNYSPSFLERKDKE